MLDFTFTATSKREAYSEITAAACALTEGESDDVANMANVAALLWLGLPDLNWVGFYRFDGAELVLGPFQGKPACIRIPLGRGVCGKAAADLQTQCIADVHTFPGHIACDAASNSEIVVPIVYQGQLIGVLDLDSPRANRFDEEDIFGLEGLVSSLGKKLLRSPRESERI